MRKSVERETAGKRSTKTAPQKTFDADALLNTMGGMVFVASPDYRIEYMNEAARRKIGRDMTGKPCFKVFHGFEERCPWCMGELVLQGQTIRQEIQGQLDKRWYSNVITPLHREDGSVSIQALVFDITDQKQSQAALVQSEALLRSIHQVAPLGIGVVRSRVLDWTNAQISRMTGYTADELRGKSARIFYPDDEEFDRVGRHKYAEIHRSGTGSIVTVWRRKDGRLINVYLSSTPIDPGDRSAGVVFTALDVTEKKKAQDELWKSEEKYRALFENAVMGIFQSTPEGRFLSVNPATAKMCGFESPEEMVTAVTDIATQHYVDPAERDLFIRAIEERGFVRNFEHRTYRRDGSVFWVSVNARAVRDRRGNISHYEGTHEDIQGRKEAEEALRLSEERYRAIFENSLVGIFQSTPEGRYVRVNPAFARIYGYESPEDVISSITDIGTQVFVDAEDRKRCMAILRETGTLERFETRTRRKDGSMIWTVINSRIVRNPEGRTLFIEGVVEDITERKQAVDALRTSEERFFKIFQSNPIPMTIATLDEGRFIDVNDRAIELSGYRWEEMAGRTSIEMGLWAYPEERDRLIVQIRETGQLRDGLAHFRTKAGKVAPALWSADRVKLGENEVILTTIHDISQQVEAQEKLRQSEATYRLLAENVTDVIWTADLNLSFTYVSPSSERVFGWNPSEWMSMPLRNFLTPASFETATRLLREEADGPGRARSGEPRVVTTELELYRKDGSTGWFEVSSQVIRDGEGKPRSIIGVTRDIAERKRAEKQNALLERQLRQAQKMEAVGTLAGGIAHDFNNILFAVIGYAELCLQDIQDEESRWNLSQILSACSRAKTLVNQILAFSRQAEQEHRPLDVVPLAKEAVKFLRSSLPATIDLSIDADVTNSFILGDATQIHQVIMNLCTNAAHAMRASGGRLRILIDNAAPPAGLLPGETDGIRSEGFLHLGVSDTGQGIEPAQLSRIFDPFFTTKAPGEGTGLGLSVVYGIVKSLGGAIGVDSSPGRGSTFDVYLPSVVTRGQEPERSVEPIPRGTESILFVDDEKHLVEVMGQVLSALGYRVTTVRESRNALRMFRENPESFDLVITDMTMPDMTGADLAREILRLRPDTPIILCTGYSELIDEEVALKIGIRRFLMKPLFMGDVAREIRAVLNDHGRSPARAESNP